MNANTPDPTPFDVRRGAVIAGGVTAFILIFRPFGIMIATLADLIAVLGFAPLNFAAIMLAHRIPGPRSAMILRAGAIILANLTYGFFIGGGASWSIAVAVAFVSALVIGAVALWNRERALNREVIELRQTAHMTRDETITLRGEGVREILRLRIQDLHFIAAKGNYAEVAYLQDGAPNIVLLRASLKGLAAQAGEGTLQPCHRSFQVNLGAAQRIFTGGGRMEIEFPGGARALVSRRYRDAIRAAVSPNAPAVPPARHSSQSD